MGGGSKGPKMRPELPVALAPSPRVTPVEQPNPPTQQNYASYYMPTGVEALRQSLLAMSEQQTAAACQRCQLVDKCRR